MSGLQSSPSLAYGAGTAPSSDDRQRKAAPCALLKQVEYRSQAHASATNTNFMHFLHWCKHPPCILRSTRML
jgi:hypothetical protein